MTRNEPSAATPSTVARRLDRELASNLERNDALLTERKRLIEAADSANVDDEHDPEGATLAFEREQLAALITQTEHARTEIEAALERVRSGTYGVCENCGRAIPAERLDARPTARRCVECAR